MTRRNSGRTNAGKLAKIILVLGVILSMGISFGCKKSGTNEYKDAEHPVATIVVKDYGTITLELYPDVAPITVANFVTLANSGFYDGLIFHRVIRGFMIQGGDPAGTGSGVSAYHIKGEFKANGVDNNIAHVPGVISMARSKAYDSACSQFFICTSTADWLDGQYAAFGMVTDGLEVAMEIERVDTNVNDKPLTDVVIESVRVDTKGVDYSNYDKYK